MSTETHINVLRQEAETAFKEAHNAIDIAWAKLQTYLQRFEAENPDQPEPPETIEKTPVPNYRKG
jgi:hypothetical protein